MKKQLIGTTALVAAGLLAGAPAAQGAEPISVSIGGYMNNWFGWSSNEEGSVGQTENTGFAQDVEVHFNATTELDNGLKIKAHIELEGNTSGDQIDETYVTLSGTFGQILLGSENSASYKMQYAAPNVGIGLSSGDVTYWIAVPTQGNGPGLFRTPFGSMGVEVGGNNDSQRITYFTPRISGFQFGVSYAPGNVQDANGPIAEAGTITNIFNAGANYVQTLNDVSVAVAAGYGIGSGPNGGVGAATRRGSDPEVVHFGTNLGFEGFTIGGAYAESNGQVSGAVGSAAAFAVDDAEGYEFGVSYKTGPWGVSVTTFRGEREGLIADPAEDEFEAYEIAASYSIGPGIKVVGSLGRGKFSGESGIAGSAAGETSNDGEWIVGGFYISF